MLPQPLAPAVTTPRCWLAAWSAQVGGWLGVDARWAAAATSCRSMLSYTPRISCRPNASATLQRIQSRVRAKRAHINGDPLAPSASVRQPPVGGRLRHATYSPTCHSDAFFRRLTLGDECALRTDRESFDWQLRGSFRCQACSLPRPIRRPQFTPRRPRRSTSFSARCAFGLNHSPCAVRGFRS